MAEFQWWLLLVGLVAGGGLVAVVFLDGARREQDVDEEELPAEAQWIAARLSREWDLRPRDIEAVLREHREYRLLPPPDRFESLAPAQSDAAALAAARAAARAEARPNASADGTATRSAGAPAPADPPGAVRE